MKFRCDDTFSRQGTRPWTIRDIADDTRRSVIRAAKREGMTISQWVNRVLNEQANQNVHPVCSVKGCSAMPMQILDELLTLNRRMERVEKQKVTPGLVDGQTEEQQVKLNGREADNPENPALRGRS
ncbi:MAG: AraC family transcriptional regulator [Magnetococcales bacterium]|nr:AraC family transcriptional regulator [Magnetococcales bacterium]